MSYKFAKMLTFLRLDTCFVGAFAMPEDELLTTREVASHLKVGEETVRRLIRQGKLPAIRFTKSYRVRRQDISVANIMARATASNHAAAAGASAGRQATLARVEAVYRECLGENWDGYGAEPVSEAVYQEARRFCESLPLSVPEPEVAADPDGEICLDWFGGEKDLFSVSVGKGGRLSYAGRFGQNRIHGTEYYTRELPETIIQSIRRHFV